MLSFFLGLLIGVGLALAGLAIIAVTKSRSGGQCTCGRDWPCDGGCE